MMGIIRPLAFFVLLAATLVFTVYSIRDARRKVFPQPMAPTAFGPYGNELVKASAETAVPLPVLVKLIKSESGFIPDAVGGPNSDGSMDLGIAQLNSKYVGYYGEKYGLTDPFNAGESIHVAARYLADLARLFGGCWACAVGAYKHGPGKWGKWVKTSQVIAYGDETKIAGRHTCGRVE